MKRYFKISLINIVIFILIGCSANEANKNSTILADKLLVSLCHLIKRRLIRNILHVTSDIIKT